ncbi:hypothetical protein FQN57_000526 [Myotisia sp. PD_48]|nr:hypothetical protein FQN57_000526 [Myotisia sp. PD_48]
MAPKLTADGYEVFTGVTDLPSNLQAATCKKLFIELLNTTRTSDPLEEKKKAKNHAIMRIEFTTVVGDIKGVRVSMDVDDKVVSDASTSTSPASKGGVLHVKPIKYTTASRSSLFTGEIAIKVPNLTLGQFVTALTSQKLQNFSFYVNANQAYFGCRDFMSQAFYQLAIQQKIENKIKAVVHGAGLFSIPTPINDILGNRIIPNATGTGTEKAPTPIGKGKFATYKRVTTGLTYAS